MKKQLDAKDLWNWRESKLIHFSAMAFNSLINQSNYEDPTAPNNILRSLLKYKSNKGEHAENFCSS